MRLTKGWGTDRWSGAGPARGTACVPASRRRLRSWAGLRLGRGRMGRRLGGEHVGLNTRWRSWRPRTRHNLDDESLTLHKEEDATRDAVRVKQTSRDPDGAHRAVDLDGTLW